MKTKFTTLALVLTSLAFAQVTIDETVFVSPGGIFYSDMDIDITASAAAKLEVEGSLKLNGTLTGASKLILQPTASLDLNAGTLTLSHEVDEEFANLTLGTSGILEVSPGKSLTLTGDLDNQNTTAGINLLADATGYAQLLTSGTVTTKGGTYAEQYLTASAKAGWRTVGSPVSTTLAEIDDDFESFYTVGTPGTLGNADQVNIKWWDASPVTPGSDANAKGWTNATYNSLSFGPGNAAYNLWVGDYHDILNANLLDVSGEIGNGDYAFDIYATQTSVQVGLSNTGWNLIPNPYPSNIDVTTLLGDNTNFGLTYKALHVWDATAQQYAAISDDAAITFTPKSATAGHNIAPFQAFLVKGSSTPSSSGTAGESITLKNAHRTIADNYNVFKTAPQLIRLNAIAENGNLDQTLITFEQNVDDNLDGRDAFKIMSMNEGMHNMYTVVDGNKIAINRKAMPEPDKHIPMQFDAPTAGAYSIDMVEATVDLGWYVELEDHKTGALHNMRDGDYTFTNDPEFKSNRFTVHINKQGESIASYHAERVYIHGNSEGINVAFGFMMEAASADVLITNLAGQILYDGTVPTDAPFIFPVQQDISMYVVHVVTNGNVTVEKIVR